MIYNLLTEVNLLSKDSLRLILMSLFAGNLDGLLVYGDSTIKQDVRVCKRLHVTGPISASNLATLASNESQDFHVHLSLLVDHDATVHGRLFVQEYGEFGANVKIKDDLLVQEDATVKDQLVVEGHLTAGSMDIGGLLDLHVVDVHIGDNLVVQGDATVKETVVVEGHMAAASGHIAGALQVDGNIDFVDEIHATDAHIGDNLVVQGDATVKEMVRVEGHMEAASGHIAGALQVDGNIDFVDEIHATDAHIGDNLVVQGDATVKETVVVDGHFTAATANIVNGVTGDFTCGTWRIDVDHGIVTSVTERDNI